MTMPWRRGCWQCVSSEQALVMQGAGVLYCKSNDDWWAVKHCIVYMCGEWCSWCCQVRRCCKQNIIVPCNPWGSSNATHHS